MDRNQPTECMMTKIKNEIYDQTKIHHQTLHDDLFIQAIETDLLEIT